MTIIDGVRAWLKTYEGLADGRLSVDFLPEEAKSYSVDTVPTTEIVKRYLDGSSIRQFLFCVSSRESLKGSVKCLETSRAKLVFSVCLAGSS